MIFSDIYIGWSQTPNTLQMLKTLFQAKFSLIKPVDLIISRRNHCIGEFGRMIIPRGERADVVSAERDATLRSATHGHGAAWRRRMLRKTRSLFVKNASRGEGRVSDARARAWTASGDCGDWRYT